MRRGRFDLVAGRGGAWFAGRRLPCAIGRGGIVADKREGDGATPLAMMRLTGVLYRADRVARPRTLLPVRAIAPGDVWSDDPRDPAYNTRQRGRDYPFSHERLARADPLYDLVVLTDWNVAGVPGQGSAIFLHQWRRPHYPTEGCIAFARDDLRWLVARWTVQSRVVVQP